MSRPEDRDCRPVTEQRFKECLGRDLYHTICGCASSPSPKATVQLLFPMNVRARSLSPNAPAFYSASYQQKPPAAYYSRFY